MYRGLTAKTPGCVAFSLPVQRRNLRNLGDSSVFPIPPRPAQRAADRSGGFEPERRPVPGYHLVPGTVYRDGVTDYPAPTGPDMRTAGERFGAAPGFQRQTRRRLLPPTCSDGPTLDAPDCIADHDPRIDRADAERKLRASFCSDGIAFGRAPRVAFWPSPHPRIRWTVASPGGAIRAYRDTRPPPS
jgi:hypothetical protein